MTRSLPHLLLCLFHFIFSLDLFHFIFSLSTCFISFFSLNPFHFIFFSHTYFISFFLSTCFISFFSQPVSFHAPGHQGSDFPSAIKNLLGWAPENWIEIFWHNPPLLRNLDRTPCFFYPPAKITTLSSDAPFRFYALRWRGASRSSWLNSSCIAKYLRWKWIEVYSVQLTRKARGPERPVRWYQLRPLTLSQFQHSI